MRRAEWLARPWRLVAVALVLIVLPLLALGEYVALDSRSRLLRTEVKATDDAAARAAELMSTRLAALADEASGVARSDELAAAVLTGDHSNVAQLLATYRNALSSEIERMLVVRVVGDVSGDRTVGVVAEFPMTGTLAPASDYVPAGVGNFSWVRSTKVVTHASLPPGVVFSEGLRISAVGVGAHGFVAEVPLERVSHWLIPLLTAAREVHVIDDRGRLIASASSAGSEVSLNVIRDVRELADRDSDLVAVADLSNVHWQTVVVREPTAVLAFDEAAGLQRVLRVAMAAALLIAAYVIAAVAARLDRERKHLTIANARLDAASEAKSRFLAAVSHDLRTPLNAILGFSDVLLQQMFGDLNTKQEEYLRDIHSAGEQQLALVDDLLDLSKIEAGKMELHPVLFSLPELLTQAMSVISPLASSKDLTLDLDLASGPSAIEHDPARVRQVVLNLLSNAIKFTPSGGRITVAVASGVDDVSISVTDTGVGIAREDQARVFDEFAQVGASARSGQGTGLGLALVRGFARMMGGDVSLRSESGVGSTFMVSLPLAQPRGIESTAIPRPAEARLVL